MKLKIKSVAHSSEGSHTGQLDFCNWLADGRVLYTYLYFVAEENPSEKEKEPTTSAN